MRLIVVLPYHNPVANWAPVVTDLVENYRKKGALQGIEVDIDEGSFAESGSERRDEEVGALISVGFIRKAREYSEMGKYDGIVSTGGLDPGFVASRVVCKIPVTASTHSAAHMASLIGERFSIVHAVAPTTLTLKHCVEAYGLGHKLASARFIGHSSTEMYHIIRKVSKKKRAEAPESKAIVDAIANQCIAAIEKDRADSLLFLCEPIQAFEDEVRQSLDKAGYEEIPIICGLYAAIEMASAMVNQKLTQAARAYPSATLKAKPEHW